MEKQQKQSVDCCLIISVNSTTAKEQQNTALQTQVMINDNQQQQQQRQTDINVKHQTINEYNKNKQHKLQPTNLPTNQLNM